MSVFDGYRLDGPGGALAGRVPLAFAVATTADAALVVAGVRVDGEFAAGAIP